MFSPVGKHYQTEKLVICSRTNEVYFQKKQRKKGGRIENALRGFFLIKQH